MPDKTTVKNQSLELLPPEGDKDVGYRVFEVFSEILQAKNDLGKPKAWNHYYNLGRNRHWKPSAMGSKEVKLVSANLLGAHRQRNVNMLTDNNPTFNAVKTGDIEDEELFETLPRAAEHWWTDQELQQKLETAVNQAETYGCVPTKVSFNPKLEFPMGEVEVEVFDPFYYGMYPVKCREPQKAEGNFHWRVYSLREAKKLFPEFADHIKGDQDKLKEIGDQRDTTQASASKQSAYTTFVSAVRHLVPGSGHTEGETDEVLVVECWVRDDTEIDGQLKYSGGIRAVAACNAGDVVLYDKDNPNVNKDLDPEEQIRTYLYDKVPFTLTPSNIDPASPWGLADYEQLEGLQKEINKTISQFTTFKDRAARLKAIIPRTSGVNPADFTNKAGILQPNMFPHGIEYLKPPEIPRDLVTGVDFFKDLFFLVSGSFELEQAQTPGREVIAYKAIQALIERATTMLRGKIRNYSKMIREWGRMYISLAQNFYTEDRWIEFSDGGQKVSQSISGQTLRIPAKLTVVSGSTMPRSKIQEREEAIALFEKGAVDNEALLQKIDWPEWKQVVKRMQAGPFGEFFEKLIGMGVPEEIIAIFNEVSQLDPKEFESAMEKGEVPPFVSLIDQLGGQEPPADPLQEAEAGKVAAETNKIGVEIEKTLAETALINEKIRTEQVVQQVKQAGVEFDAAKIRIEEAQTIADIENAKVTNAINSTKVISDVETARMKKTGGDDSKLEGKSAKTNTQGSFREKGMKSDNKK